MSFIARNDYNRLWTRHSFHQANLVAGRSSPAEVGDRKLSHSDRADGLVVHAMEIWRDRDTRSERTIRPSQRTGMKTLPINAEKAETTSANAIQAWKQKEKAARASVTASAFMKWDRTRKRPTNLINPRSATASQEKISTAITRQKNMANGAEGVKNATNSWSRQEAGPRSSTIQSRFQSSKSQNTAQVTSKASNVASDSTIDKWRRMETRKTSNDASESSDEDTTKACALSKWQERDRDAKPLVPAQNFPFSSQLKQIAEESPEDLEKIDETEKLKPQQEVAAITSIDKLIPAESRGVKLSPPPSPPSNARKEVRFVGAAEAPIEDRTSTESDSDDELYSAKPSIVTPVEVGAHTPIIRSLELHACTVIKHGRCGGTRRVQLRFDAIRGVIQWGGEERRQIKVMEITQIRAGKQTETFQKRGKKPLPASRCFSIVTDSRTLDIEVTNSEERKKMMKSIMQSIVQYLRDNSINASWSNSAAS